MPKKQDSCPWRPVIVALATAYFFGGSLHAHHSPAPFDLEETVAIEGVVARYHWANPHVYIDVEVTREDGNKEIWEVEGAWPASLVPHGWSRDTLKAGDPVEVTGNPGRDAARRIMLGRSLRTAATTRPLNWGPGGAPASVASLTDEDRTGMPAADALVGTWLPVEQNPFVAFARFMSPSPLLTDKAQAALEAGRLRRGDETEEEAAGCVPKRPPFNMALHEVKTFEARGDDIIIRLAVIGDTERIVHMNEASGDSGAQGWQGHSVGRWERDTLVVDTTFDGEDVEDRGIIDGVPLGGSTRLVERFELTEDRKRLTYTYSVENPEYLTEPFTQSADWAFRPDIEIPRLECDSGIARRFLED